jgi:predicted RNase H-like HicB family nuclease
MSEARQYLIVIEGDGETNFSAYAPDLPGCIATGATLAEVEELMREGIRLHLEVMLEGGEPIPEPTAVGAALVAV